MNLYKELSGALEARTSIAFTLQSLQYNALTRILATKLDIWVTDMGDTLTVLFITRVHAVSVTVTMPTHGNAEGIQPALKLICMAASRWACGWEWNNKEVAYQRLRAIDQVWIASRVQLRWVDNGSLHDKL